ncbi:teichoic acids export ABC transporter ATP-binding subunit TagH [Neobacillus niacini]|uniref:teichoic acids export ABC transporter ATP-binding subunit TagH n=1 Tax=Neobacillus niacini TaxID=86668 RepID=UPI0039838CAE
MSKSVLFKNVTKKYKMYQKTSDKLLDLALPSGYGKDFFALQNISFWADKGDIIGIIGVNGAGKSTLSNLISGVIPPTTGSINIEGDAALISIAAGLNNQLTGRENIELKCLMLGFSKNDIQKLMPEIIEFSELGDFIDQPVKKYSSGMKSRLGFAISVNIDPDVLVIDEALSVGDKLFAQKCLEKMNSFKEKGKTIFFISHSIGQVKEFCQKAIWLEAGEIKAYGPIEEVVPQYEQFIKEFNKMSNEEKKKFGRRIMEKRSKLQHEPIPTDKGEGLSSNTKSRKKPKRKGLNIFRSFLILTLLVASSATYLNWDKVYSYLQPEEKMLINNSKQEEKETPPTSVETMENVIKDIRYVNIEAGFVRDSPNLSSSSKIMMVYFGDSINVKEMKKDPANDFNWLKFSLSSGQDGWISERLVTQIESPDDEGALISTMEEIIQLDGSTDLMGIIGKSEQELYNIDKTNIEISYDEANAVDQFSIMLNSLTKEELVGRLGEPSLQQGESTFLYHGKSVDLIFTGQNRFNLTVKRIPS